MVDPNAKTSPSALMKYPLGLHGFGDGLFLRVVSETGKTWVYRYRRPGRKTPTDLTLGKLRDYDLSAARLLHATERKLFLAGVDPVTARKVAKRSAVTGAVTFKSRATQYHEDHKEAWTKRHAADWIGSLEKHIFPTLGKTAIADVTAIDVREVIKPLWKKSRVTAERVLRRMWLVFDAAKADDQRTGSNPAAMEGNLVHHLPKRARGQQVEHFKWMPYAEIGAFMAKLRAKEGVDYRATELLILTAARSINVLGARWSEFDLNKARWTVDGRFMKNGRTHEFYLSPPAVALLRELEKVRTTDASDGLVFPGRKKGKPRTDKTFRQVLEDLGVTAYDVHGFRGSFSTWANEATPYKEIVVEVSLAHGNSDKTAAAYNHATFKTWRTTLMADWAAHCAIAPAAAAP